MATVEVSEHSNPSPKETEDLEGYASAPSVEVADLGKNTRKTLGPGKSQCGVQMVEGEETGDFR